MRKISQGGDIFEIQNKWFQKFVSTNSNVNNKLCEKIFDENKTILLIYHENNKQKLWCFTNNQIELILQHMHNKQNYYSHLIILNCLKSEKYWFTKTQNVMT